MSSWDRPWRGHPDAPQKGIHGERAKLRDGEIKVSYQHII
jgi:hypothetical protein